jgi:hypothetical protein
MKTIWKYPLEITDQQSVTMPEGAKILTAQMQGRDLCLWAIVDPDARHHEDRHIQIVGTGHLIEGLEDAKQFSYIASVQMGALVWHVFERS